MKYKTYWEQMWQDTLDTIQWDRLALFFTLYFFVGIFISIYEGFWNALIWGYIIIQSIFSLL